MILKQKQKQKHEHTKTFENTRSCHTNITSFWIIGSNKKIVKYRSS